MSTGESLDLKSPHISYLFKLNLQESLLITISRIFSKSPELDSQERHHSYDDIQTCSRMAVVDGCASVSRIALILCSCSIQPFRYAVSSDAFSLEI